jgi:hypothetical protein
MDSDLNEPILVVGYHALKQITKQHIFILSLFTLSGEHLKNEYIDETTENKIETWKIDGHIVVFLFTNGDLQLMNLLTMKQILYLSCPCPASFVEIKSKQTNEHFILKYHLEMSNLFFTLSNCSCSCCLECRSTCTDPSGVIISTYCNSEYIWYIGSASSECIRIRINELPTSGQEMNK